MQTKGWTFIRNIPREGASHIFQWLIKNELGHRIFPSGFLISIELQIPKFQELTLFLGL